MALEDDISNVLRTPIGSIIKDPSFGFEGLEEDGTTRIGISEQVFAEQARAALTRKIPGVVFNEITCHRDGRGQLIKIEVDYMNEIPRSIVPNGGHRLSKLIASPAICGRSRT